MDRFRQVPIPVQRRRPTDTFVLERAAAMAAITKLHCTAAKRVMGTLEKAQALTLKQADTPPGTPDTAAVRAHMQAYLDAIMGVLQEAGFALAGADVDFVELDRRAAHTDRQLTEKSAVFLQHMHTIMEETHGKEGTEPAWLGSADADGQ